MVILSLPPVHALVGEHVIAILIASDTLSLALTPTLAGVGRVLAGQIRRHAPRPADLEIRPVTGDRPVFIARMGRVGRELADALIAFDISYAAIEKDEKHLRQAVADAYDVSFGDFSDPHIWGPFAASGHHILMLTAPTFDTSTHLAAAARRRFPGLPHVAVVHDEAQAEQFRSIGSKPVIARSATPGFDVAVSVLSDLEIGAERIA